MYHRGAHGLWVPSPAVQAARSVRGSVVQSRNRGAGGSAPTMPPPDWVEDFTGYTSSANLVAYTPTKTVQGQNMWFNFSQSNPSQIFLDTTVGYSPLGLTQSMRYDFPAMSGNVNDYTICLGTGELPQVGLNTTLPQEMWCEWVATFSSNFVTKNNNYTGGANPDYKFFFMTTDQGPQFQGGNGRCELKVGTFGTPGELDLGASTIVEDSWTTTVNNFWDGTPHVYRAHFKLPTSTAVLSFDGTVELNNSNWTSNGANSTYFWGITPGANLNQSSQNNSSLWWHYIAIWWTQNPGWGI